MIRKLIFPKRNFELDLEIELDEFERRLEKNMLFSGEMVDRKLAHLKKYRGEKIGDFFVIERLRPFANSPDPELFASVNPIRGKINISGQVRIQKKSIAVYILILAFLILVPLYQFLTGPAFFEIDMSFLISSLILMALLLGLFRLIGNSATKNFHQELLKEFKSWEKPEKNYF